MRITRDNLFMRMKEAEWEEVINLNLNSNFILAKLIIKHDKVKMGKNYQYFI